MNANQIINMVMRMVMKRGLNAGFDVIGKKMSKGKGDQSAKVQSGNSQTGTQQSMQLKKF